MKLRKKEVERLVEVAGQPVDSPEEAVTNIAAALDEVRGERRFFAAILTMHGLVPQVIGPFATQKQAYRAVEASGALPGGKAYLATLFTPEGWKSHLDALDKPPKSKGDFAEIMLDQKAFRHGWDGKNATRGEYLTNEGDH